MPPIDFERFNDRRQALAGLDRQLLDNRQSIEQLSRSQAAAHTGADPDTLTRLSNDIAAAVEAQDRLRLSRTEIQNQLLNFAFDALVDSDDLVARLDGGIPMALLPVRLETRFSSDTELRIRVYPDQIHLAGHASDITETEALIATRYWDAVWADPSTTASAWTSTAAQMGAERAKYVLDCFCPNNLDARNLGVAPSYPAVATVAVAVKPRPTARLLPSRWLVRITGPNDLLLHQDWFENPVAEDLPMSPIGDPLDIRAPEAAAGDDMPMAADDTARWLIDFAAAQAAGMATTVRLAPGKSFAAGVGTVVVVGVDLSRTPAESSQLLVEQLRNHGHSDGFGLIAPDTPSNNSSAAPSTLGGTDRDRCATIKLASAPDTRVGVDIERLLTAFGAPDATPSYAGMPGTDLSYEATVNAVHTALWGASFGYFFGHMLSPLVSEATTRDIRTLLRDHARPAGPLATIRVGRQPYGVLPILPPRSELINGPDSLTGGFSRALPQMLNRIRVLTENTALVGPGGETVYLNPLDEIPTLTKLPPGTSSAEVLARILKLSPVATRLNVRASVGPLALAVSDNPNDKAAQQHRQIIDLILANLGFPPLALVLFEKRPLIYDLVIDSHNRYRLRKMPFVAEDLTAPGVLSAAVGKVKERIATASGDSSMAHALLAIAADDATSLLEGLLMLSGAFEYWSAGERIVRPEALDAAQNAFLVNAEFVGLAAAPVAPAGTAAVIETPHQLFQVAGPATDNEPLIRFITTASRRVDPPVAVRDVRAFNDAADELAMRPPWEVDHALRGLLDLGSHRLDAFITSVATRRLRSLRDSAPSGIHLGGYGILHDLRRTASPDSEGYIHVPSLDHALTASVLRSGHMANRDANPQAFAVRLTSARVRDALHVSDGMAQGQSTGALLGYRFERWLIGDRLRAKYIHPLRQLHPQPTDPVTPDQPAESIPAHDVVDGLALAEAWMADGGGLLTRLEAVTGVIPAADRQALRDHLTRLADLFDAFSDLWITEAVHQLGRGNTARAAAATAVIDRQAKPAEPQVVHTPRGAWGYTQRVMLVAEPAAADAWPEDLISAIAPAANQLAAAMLGDPARFAIAVYAVGDDGTRIPGRAPFTVPLDQLPISPLRLVLTASPQQDDAPSRLEEAVAAVARTEPGFVDMTLAVDLSAPPGMPSSTSGFGKLIALLESCRRVLTGRRPLSLADFTVAHDLANSTAPADAAALTSAAEKARGAVAAAATQLTDGIDSLDVAAVLAGLRDCRALMMRVPQWTDVDHPDVGSDDIIAAAKAVQTRLTTILDSWDQQSGETVADRETARLVLVFGKDFLALPDITLPPAIAQSWQAAVDSQATLRGDSGRTAVTRWRRQTAMVRKPMRDLIDVWDAAALTGHPTAGEANIVAQLPHTPDTPWVGLPFPRVDGTPVRPEVSMSAVVFGHFDPTQPVAGLLIDEWAEAVPERDTPTSISYQYDAPAARPPQSILLAVTPVDHPHWSVSTLIDTVHEAIKLSQLRLLQPQDIPGGGAILPTTFIPSNASQQLPSWNVMDFTIDTTPLLGKS